MKPAARSRTRLDTQVYRSYDHPALTPDVWRNVAASGKTNSVFQDWYWQRAWWSHFGRGELVIVRVSDHSGPIAFAPFFIDGDMAFLVGSGGSDYLDVVGNAEPHIVSEAIGAVWEHRPDLIGLRFYLVPDDSSTGVALQSVAGGLGLVCFDEGEIVAPYLEFSASAPVDQNSLVRGERSLRRLGPLTFEHFASTDDILPRLEGFFEQHERRWEDTPFPSLFSDTRQRAFYRDLARCADDAGWLRFSVASSSGESVAFHLGFQHQRTFVYYKPSYAVAFGRYSPGHALLRQLIVTAHATGARIFDFGIGDEDYKRKFASSARYVRTWGVYRNDICRAS